MGTRPRIAVVSPFLDKRHGTERCVAEQVERLACDYEIHVYSNRVEDVDPASIVFHRVPSLPGPHLFAYGWWFFANHLWRWRHRRISGLRFDLTYTPGVNCLDADVISVHIVFSKFYPQVKAALDLRSNPASSRARLFHRKLYYRLIIKLEQIVYRRKKCKLIGVSRRTSEDLERFGRFETPIIYHGLDVGKFDPGKREILRGESRKTLGLPDSAFCLLLVGNDWNNKGLVCLIEALGSIPVATLRLLIVGRDDPAPYLSLLKRHKVEQIVTFLPAPAGR